MKVKGAINNYIFQKYEIGVTQVPNGFYIYIAQLANKIELADPKAIGYKTICKGCKNDGDIENEIMTFCVETYHATPRQVYVLKTTQEKTQEIMEDLTEYEIES